MLTSPFESAILIKVPQAEYLVGPYRNSLDPSQKWGVPAHITLLYPFLPPAQIDARVIAKLETLIGSFSSFEFDLGQTEWFGDQVLWLSPEPALPFQSLMDALFAGFPETRPYGGVDFDPIPHLTIADGADFKIMQKVESDIHSKLPIHATIESVSVMAGSHEPDSWKSIAEIPLGAEGRK